MSCSITIHSFYPPPSIDKTTLDTVKAELQNLPKDIRISFNKKIDRIDCVYDEFTLRALAYKYPVVAKIIGYGYQTRFDGYFGEWMLQETKYSKRCTQFLIKAKKYFKMHPECALERQLSLDHERGIKKYVEHMLTKSPGIVFGENHSNEASRAFLCKEMAFLVSQGIDTFYLEHLCKERLQKDLDDYFMKGQNMSSGLLARLERMDSGYQLKEFTYLKLVQVAKKCGLRRLVCLDSAYSYRAGTSTQDGVKNSILRHTAFMYQAKQIFKKEKPQNKFIALIGSRHLLKNGTVPGFGVLFNCPEVYIMEEKKSPNISMIRQCCVEDEDTDTKYHFPLVCTIPAQVYRQSQSFGSEEHQFFSNKVHVL